MEKETLEERIQYISFLHKQNLNGRETEDELFEAGILAGIEETKEKMYGCEEVKRLAFDFYYEMSRKMGVAENLISENATNVDVWFEKLKKG